MTNPHPVTEATVAAYERAIAAEPALRTAVRLVDALTTLVRPDDELCNGCVWKLILKPIVSPLVGWGRGYLPDQARDPDPDGTTLRIVTIDEFLAREDHRVEATTDAEAWLRTPEAYDAFTGVLLARLYDADPANGCGIRSGATKGQPA